MKYTMSLVSRNNYDTGSHASCKLNGIFNGNTEIGCFSSSDSGSGGMNSECTNDKTMHNYLQCQSTSIHLEVEWVTQQSPFRMMAVLHKYF